MGLQGNSAYIKFAHRFSAEFAREAMTDQMELFPGQGEPLLLKWAVQGSGNPFDFANDQEKAAFEIAQIKASQSYKRQRGGSDLK